MERGAGSSGAARRGITHTHPFTFNFILTQAEKGLDEPGSDLTEQTRRLIKTLLRCFSRFYDEIGTPLLSDIRIDYTENSVQYVTQHLFTNYFNGSEIVVAGKLTDQSAESLHVQVTASNNDKSIVLETDVPLRHRQKETEKHVKEAAMAAGAKAPGSGGSHGSGNTLGSIAEDFVERVWGFLSVKEELRSRLRSQTSKERQDHIHLATNLSLTYNFLTPLTNLLVERPVVLADGSMAPAPTVTPEPGETLLTDNDLPAETGDRKLQKSDGRPSSQASSLSNNIGEDTSSGFVLWGGLLPDVNTPHKTISNVR